MWILFLFLAAAGLRGATFGTAVPVVGGATDIVLDEGRGAIYVVNSTQARIDVFTTAQRRLVRSIPVGLQPLSAALSRNRQYLYVTSYGGSSLDVVDLDANVVVRKVTLPAAPEGVAVGGDERVLITTIGSGTNNADNRLMLFDPFAEGTDVLRSIPVTLPAPAAPGTITSSRVFMSTRSNLMASADGRIIIGLNNPNTTTRQIFVYEAASGSVLRSRSVTSISNVLAVAPDGSKFMAGLSLFDTETLAIVAQQNTANSLYPFENNANFNTQQNQGGSVFAPDGTVVYAAFNIAPVQTPAAAANVTQLLLSDPDNLLIQMGVQLPESLAGNMTIDGRGENIYALSQSGFLHIPIGTMYNQPVAILDSPAGVLLNDQCGVNNAASQSQVRVRNAGRGQMAVTASVMQSGPTFTFPIGGQAGGQTGGGGAGGGAPGVVIPIVLPPGQGGVGGGQIVIPGTGTTTTQQQTGVAQNAPRVTTTRTDTETIFTFGFNSTAARSLGTIAPTDFLVQSPQAINIPYRVRVFQNNRNAEARGSLATPAVSISTAEGLSDLVLDTARGKVYIANSGLNRIEVFDTESGTFLAPVKVGQLPRSLAMTPNGRFLYVANTGGESISIIDLEIREVSGTVKFPPVPYNASFALVTPSLLAATLGGVQVVMSSGALWKIVGDEALPRAVSPVIGTAAIAAPRTIAATPDGEYALLLGGTGTAYLYDAMSDEYVLSQSVVTTPIQGYFGPVTAGPRGAYFVVNGRVLGPTLTPLTSGVTTLSRPVAAVAAVSATQIARFAPPSISTANAVVRDTPQVELVDVATGLTRSVSPMLEGPLSTQVGTQRVNVNGRSLAVDSARNLAYVLTVSGLSVVPLNAAVTGGAGGGASAATSISSNGVLSLASGKTAIAPGSVISIYGQNLGSSGSMSSTPMPTRLGGTCVTLDESPLPLAMTSTGQINAYLPETVTVGRHSLVVRAYERNAASAMYSLTVSKFAPSVFVNETTTQAAVYKANGSAVTNRNKANRDEALTMYASGLGVTKDGVPVEDVQVFFGDPRMTQSEVIVDKVELDAAAMGVFRLSLRVPGFHTSGDSLPVTLRIGGVDSPAGVTTGVN
ncbi:MAG: beta-propeller fold lactonase family protein [Bryobacterales bacterium]|nr:beta-propeller fold lactonase family protein [Bryobacterales bacterium]